ncbi:hypothetical protein [Oligoflexus tunisiensis]|uniref:hypothetical protein n=1 Tax=Oligoflexus tunisiensis TaxID=708132 RepID=UPI00114C9451|nr:hypothetical protein [Oligoflexus tunisiensis]
MIRLILTWMVMVLLLSCSSTPQRSVTEEDDFALDLEDDGDKVDDKGYFSDLQRSDAALGFESSFPLPFAVGKSIDRFETTPEQAKNPSASVISVMLGTCKFALKTGPVQVDRYILAGQWIKLNESLPASVPVKLEPYMDLNLKMAAKLVVDIANSDLPTCRALLSGRRVYIGRFHLNKSRVGLLAGPGYPRAVFSSRSMEPRGKRVFIRWQPGAAAPMLIDDFDFPATSESGIFRALMGEKGYYYLVFQPALRMDQVDEVMIKIPFSPDGRNRKQNRSRPRRKQDS